MRAMQNVNSLIKEEEKGVKGRGGEEEEGKEEEKGYLEGGDYFLSMMQNASKKCGL